MASLRRNLSNLLEYFGVASTDYFHTVPEPNYDPDDIRAYYLDMRPRADYPGPFNQDRIPLLEVDGGRTEFPSHIAMFALGHLEIYRREGGVKHLNEFRRAVYWFKEHQRDDGAWTINTAMPKFQIQPPFVSAMVQGLGISVLVRAGIVFDSDRFIESAGQAVEPFGRTVDAGGVTTRHEAGSWYEEYPSQPPRHVLNGFIYALFGLYDLIRHRRDHRALEHWNAGVSLMKAWLPRFDTGHWSRYQLPEKPFNPATVAYHRLHVNQLAVMAELTGDENIAAYRDRWHGYLDSRSNALGTLPAKLRWLNSKSF